MAIYAPRVRAAKVNGNFAPQVRTPIRDCSAGECSANKSHGSRSRFRSASARSPSLSPTPSPDRIPRSTLREHGSAICLRECCSRRDFPPNSVQVRGRSASPQRDPWASSSIASPRSPVVCRSSPGALSCEPWRLIYQAALCGLVPLAPGQPAGSVRKAGDCGMTCFLKTGFNAHGTKRPVLLSVRTGLFRFCTSILYCKNERQD